VRIHEGAALSSSTSARLGKQQLLHGGSLSRTVRLEGGHGAAYPRGRRREDGVTGTTAAPVRDVPVSPWHAVGPRARACRRPLLVLVVAAFVAVTLRYGYPTGRDVITAWVALLLLAACGGNVPVWARSVVRDWLPLTAVLFLYDRLRGSADAFGARLADLSTCRTSWCRSGSPSGCGSAATTSTPATPGRWSP
jgi:hypothetical protein